MLKALENTVSPDDIKTITDLLTNKSSNISSNERNQLISRLMASITAEPKIDAPKRKALKDMTEEEKEVCREEIRQRLKNSQKPQVTDSVDQLSQLMSNLNIETTATTTDAQQKNEINEEKLEDFIN